MGQNNKCGICACKSHGTPKCTISLVSVRMQGSYLVAILMKSKHTCSKPLHAYYTLDYMHSHT